jgi:hypothetical protein
MATNQDKQYIPKSRIVPGTQERAMELNIGGATQIVLNKREKKPMRTEGIKNENTKPEE